MPETPYRRRGLLVAAAAGSAVLAAGGVGAFAANFRGQSGYADAVSATWRHGDTSDLTFAAVQRELIRYATLAANSHNTQPWRFRLADHAILVLPDAVRRLAAVDPDDHHLFASLGGAVENLAEAARTFGMQAVAAFDSGTRGIRVDLEPGPRERTDLFNAIPHRQSTRAVYDGQAVLAGDLRLLEAAGNGDGVRMLLFTEPRQLESILAFLIAGNTAQMDDAAFIGELKSWIRFSYADALATQDGLFGKCSGNPALPGWVGRPVFDRVFTKASENQKYVSQLRSSSGVAVFVCDRNEPAGWVAAGRRSQRFALQATALGLRHAYINQPVEVPAVRGQFAAYLGVNDSRPDLVMRFGYGPELPRSLRRPLAQVIAEA